jgi:hypothetical protein
MTAIYRDLGFFCLALVIYETILEDHGVIRLWEAWIILALTLVYFFAIYFTNRRYNTKMLG